jgi:limonene 1,2-monooxygenase
VLLGYFGETLGYGVPDVPRERLLEHMMDNHLLICGTPDDAIAAIERLQEISGGFGGFLIRVEDWAPREKLLRSYELFSRYVMPHFQGSLAGLQQTQRLTASMRDTLNQRRIAGLRSATDSYFGATAGSRGDAPPR